MGLAEPAALWWSLLALPLVLLYVLKLRRRPVRVSSTLLWRRVVEDRRANAPWERLRRHLLLLIQLLLLALLVAALAGPFRQGRVRLAAQTVLVLDGSASMLARGPDGRSRFEKARTEAGRLIGGADSSRRLGLILAGPQPLVLSPLSDDAAGLRRALAQAAPSEAPADLRAALDLARTLVRGRSVGELVLISDGAHEPEPALLELLAGARLIDVGEAAPNAGIVSVASRRLPGAAGSQELFAGLLAQGGSTRAVDLVLEAEGAEGRWAERARATVVLEPGRRHGRLFEVEALPGSRLRLRLESAEEDALPLDDEVQLVVPPPPDVQVLLISSSPWLLSQALSAVPGVRLHVSEGVPADAASYDLAVIDGLVPAIPPTLPLLVFGAGAPADEGPFAARGELSRPRVVRWDRRHPALRHVDLDAVLIESAHRVQPPREAAILVETDEVPLAATWNGPGGPVLHFAFDLMRSDLPLRVAFPVLIHDSVDWLTARRASQAVLAAGRSADIRIGETEGPAVWTGPDGRERLLEPSAGVVRLPAPERTGRHELRWRPSLPPGAAEEHRVIPVALLSPQESDLRPRLDSSAVEARAEAAGAPPERIAGRRPLWPWLAALALVAIFVEWTVFHRRPS